MSTPLYDVLLVAHIVTALVGFGAVAVSGLSAGRGRRVPDPTSDESVVAYFRPGPDWAGRIIFVVPALGLALLFGGDRSQVGSVWPWAGLGAWVVAVGIATAMAWPAERRAQAELAAVSDGEPSRLEAFRIECRRMERAVALVEVCFVVALALMILQPR